MTHFADRLQDIQPFHVMDILARSKVLESEGRSIIHMEIGEPDFSTPDEITQAGVKAITENEIKYTPALGLASLRQAIADSYPKAYRPSAERVVITPGASGALQLIFAALLNPGDEVLMTDPGYPCYRHFVRLFEGRANAIAVNADDGYQLSADLILRHWSDQTVAVLLSSPSNPTGMLIANERLEQITELLKQKQGVLIVDEIYHGLHYDAQPDSIIRYSDAAFAVNSFSKYYGMTGWRIGWMIVPEVYLSAIDKLAQNIFISTSTPAQYAALAAFSEPVISELQRRKAIFQKRRDYLIPALRDLGFEIPVTPQGAFYVYANCRHLSTDSYQFCQALLDQAGVAVTPGIDFGSNQPEQHIRFSYANTLDKLEQGVDRIKLFLEQGG